MVTQILVQNGLTGLPVYGSGASSGGGVMMNLPFTMYLAQKASAASVPALALSAALAKSLLVSAEGYSSLVAAAAVANASVLQTAVQVTANALAANLSAEAVMGNASAAFAAPAAPPPPPGAVKANAAAFVLRLSGIYMGAWHAQGRVPLGSAYKRMRLPQLHALVLLLQRLTRRAWRAAARRSRSPASLQQFLCSSQ